MKNEEYTTMQKAIAAYWESVLSRIRNFNTDTIPPERVEGATEAMQELEARAEKERDAFTELLDHVYQTAPLSQPSMLNKARHELQEKQLVWDNEFAMFEKKYIISDFEKTRRATSTQLRRLFDPAGSAPASPDFRGGFLVSASSASSTAGSARSEAAEPTSSLSAMAAVIASAATATLSLPGDTYRASTSGDVTPVDVNLTPSSLTAANLSQLPVDDRLAELDRSAALPRRDPVSSAPAAARLPMVQLARENDNATDSDTTVCAEPIGPTRRELPYDSLRSESEDIEPGPVGLTSRARKARAVSSVASEPTFAILRKHPADLTCRSCAALRRTRASQRSSACLDERRSLTLKISVLAQRATQREAPEIRLFRATTDAVEVQRRRGAQYSIGWRHASISRYTTFLEDSRHTPCPHAFQTLAIWKHSTELTGPIS